MRRLRLHQRYRALLDNGDGKLGKPGSHSRRCVISLLLSPPEHPNASYRAVNKLHSFIRCITPNFENRLAQVTPFKSYPPQRRPDEARIQQRRSLERHPCYPRPFEDDAGEYQWPLNNGLLIPLPRVEKERNQRSTIHLNERRAPLAPGQLREAV